MRIAVTGATGFVGSHLVETLLSRGHTVTCLARSPRRHRWLPTHPAVRVVYGDLDAEEALRDLVRGQDVVVHVAGVVRAKDNEGFVAANVRGSLNLVRALEWTRTRPRQLVYVSSMAALGPCRNGGTVPVPEDADLVPVSRYGRSKAAAENALRTHGCPFPITVVRPPAVYGPRDRDVLAYFQAVSRGIKPIVGGRNTVSLVYAKNLALGMALAIEDTPPASRAYSFTDGAALSWPKLAEIIGTCLGRRTVTIPIPTALMRLAAGISGLYTAVTGQAVLLNRDKLTEARYPHWVVSDERARRELGYRPQYTTAQAVQETAAWYGEHGWM